MFSSQILLVLLGLGILALVCSLMPVSPTPKSALLFLIAAIASAFLPVIFGIIAGGIVAGLIFADSLIARTKVKVKRNFPTQIFRGVPAEYQLTTKTKSNFLTKVVARQPMCSEIQLTNKEGVEKFKGSLLGLRRGNFAIPPYALRIYGPMRLAVWHRPSKEEHSIKVMPDLPAAQQIATSIAHGRFGAAGLKRRGPLGLGTNFESVREYFPDDDMRHVNWAATNRVGYPMTNQYRVEQDRDVICLLDTGRLMMAPLVQKVTTGIVGGKVFKSEITNGDLIEDIDVEVGATRLDCAIDSLCAIAAVSEVMGDRIGVISFDSQIKKHLKPRRSGANSVVKTVFDLEPIPVDSDFEAAFSRIGKSKRSMVIIFTDFLDEASAGPLIRSLPAITKKHKVVVASIIDSDIEKLDSELNDNFEDDRLLKVTINQMKNAAEKVVSLVAQTGAEVVYVNRDELSVECVRKYLDAKQQGKI